MLNEIVGTLLELAVFFYVFYKIMDFDKERILLYFGLYISMTTLVVVSNKIIPGYGAFVYIFMFIFALKWFSRESLFKVLFLFISTMIALLSLEIVMLFTVGQMVKDELGLTLIALSIANLIMFFAVRRYEESLKAYVQKYENKYINFIAINVFIFAFIYKILWDHDDSIVRENAIFFGIGMLLLLVVNYFVYREIASMSERNKALEVQEQMRGTLEQIISEIRTKQHEYKNNLTTIIGLLETNEPADGVEAVLEFLKDVYAYDAFDNKLLAIDRDIIKAVVFMKQSEARDRGVNLEFVYRGGFKQLAILDFEISVILNNLLNNAFEAVENDEAPSVILELGFDKNTGGCYIRTKNAGHNVNPANLSKLASKNFSTKASSNGERGFGLWNVKKIIKKYGGHIEFYFEDSMLIVEVMLF